MICPYCKSQIDQDSFHCDRCGKELLICSKCGKPGKGKNCIEDGAKLFSPKQESKDEDQNKTLQKTNTAPKKISILGQGGYNHDPTLSNAKVNSGNIQVSNTSPPSQRKIKKTILPPQKPGQKPVYSYLDAPSLEIVNNSLNIRIPIQNGDFIGRSRGPHLNIFSQYQQISARHVEFAFHKDKGWCVKDLGSTNGTKISNTTNWEAVSTIEPHKHTPINDIHYILIANIEFQIIFSSQSSITGTIRL